MSASRWEDWFYLSFANDDAFLGACLVRGRSIEEAVREADRLKINPGGEALGGPVPVGGLPDEKFRERLLSKTELGAVFPDLMRVPEADYKRARRR